MQVLFFTSSQLLKKIAMKSIWNAGLRNTWPKPALEDLSFFWCNYKQNVHQYNHCNAKTLTGSNVVSVAVVSVLSLLYEQTELIKPYAEKCLLWSILKTQIHKCTVGQIHKHTCAQIQEYTKHENLSQSATTVGSTVSTEDVEKKPFGQRCHSHRDKTISQIESNSLIFFLKGKYSVFIVASSLFKIQLIFR